MKKILSATGSPIEFTITSSRKLLIGIENAIEVSEEELSVLLNRLGNQIKVVDETPSPVQDTPAEVVPEATPEVTPELEAPVVADEEVEATPEVVPES